MTTHMEIRLGMYCHEWSCDVHSCSYQLMFKIKTHKIKSVLALSSFIPHSKYMCFFKIEK